MKKEKLNIIVFSVVLLLLLSILPTFFGSATKIDDTNKNILFRTENFKEIEPSVNKYYNNLQTSFSDSDDVLISNKNGNESHPSMAVSGEKVIVAYDYEYEGNESVCLKQSSDYGLTWSDTIREYKDAISPSFTEIKYGGAFFGTFLSTKNSSYIYEVSGSGNAFEWDYSNITKPGTNEYMGRFFDFETPDVSSYSDSTVNWIIGSIGDGEFIEEYEDYDCDDSPLFFYKDAEEPENSRVIVFFPEVTGCNNISIKSGLDSEENPMLYGACEIYNGTKNNLLFFHGNPDIWDDDDEEELRKQILIYSENLYHPQIFTNEDDIYIVTETESNKIKLFHSSNYGEENSWNIYNVTDETSSNPQLFVKNNNILCTFIKSNNLYKTISENNGEDWSEPEKVNSNSGSVVDGYKNTDIGDPDRIVWTDNRSEDNTDLYMHLGYQPSVDLNLVNVTLTKDRPFLPTNNYILVTIRNDGNVATTKDIPVNISYERENGNRTYIKYPFVISDILSPGGEVTRKRPMFKFFFPEYFMSFANFAGITNITVHIDPEHTIDDSNLDNNIKTIDVDYKDIFPRVGRNENLELIFQIIALLFELILG